jgi:predicted Zn-dependent protease
MYSRNSKISMVLALIVAVALTAYAADNRTKLKPGWNLFSPEQDVEMGREVAKQAESELPMLNDQQANAYIDALGKRLAAKAPGEKYPYQFKIVNDPSINAFALPGGFIYIHRGIIDAADNEAHLAGVMAHEIGHVALRHGTNQVSKAYLAQAPLAILGGVLGSGSTGAVLAQLGVSFAANSLLLKYSRDAETQADLLGTQILYDNGYDPRAMVQFFEKIQAQSKGRAVEFFSSHPNPENRIGNTQREIERIGGMPANMRNDSTQFQNVKARLAGMPAPKTGATPGAAPTADRGRTPDAPSTRTRTYNGQAMQFRYPDNWRQSGQGSAMTIAPDGGVINNALAYGMIISTFEPEYRSGQNRLTLEDARDQLISSLRQSNPDMRIARNHEATRVNGRQAYLTEASNQSPAGGLETNWIITTMAADGTVYYFVGVAPQAQFNNYRRTFQNIIDSVRFR